MTIVMTVNLLVLGGLAFLVVRLGRQLAKQQELDTRLTQLREALTILTDATENGFAAVTTRLAPEPPASPAPKRTRRAPATRTKRVPAEPLTLAEVAAKEGVSEGEVHLRLSLADAARAAKSAAKRTNGRRRNVAAESQHA